MNDSDIYQDSDSDSHENICEIDSDTEVIYDSYFKINTIDILLKKNTKLKSKLVMLKNINETINENLSISKNTILEMNQMISELTNKVNELECENKEITSKLTLTDEQNQVLINENTNLTQNIKKLDEQIDKNSVGIQVIITEPDNNWFLSKAVYFFFLVSCSGIMYNYNHINKPK